MMINLKELYNRIAEHIKAVDFSKLWRGFSPLKFALYTADECYFDGEYIKKTDEFLGNTAISYGGEIIAIWCVSDDSDSVVLASKLIHEMFHGFQMANMESRFPDELDALYRYKYDDTNLSLKLKENQLTAELVDAFDSEKYEELLCTRKYRYDRFPYEYRYEACIEQIEGTAEFVELGALAQLSEEKFREKLNTLKSRITEKTSLVPVRIVSYGIGALLLLILNQNGINFESGFGKIPFSESLIAQVRGCLGEVELTMSEVIDGYYEKARRIIARGLAKNDVVTDELADILGVNVYNAVYCDGYIISRYFVMYGDEENRKVEYGDFLIETKEHKKLSKIYRI